MVAKWSEIFDTGSLATRVHMSDYFKVKINKENESSSDGEQRVGIFEYVVCDQPTPTRWPTSTQAVPIWLKDTLMKEEVLKEYDIFTDGSFDNELEPVAFLLDRKVKTISGAAVVLAGTGQNWMNEPIITVRIQNDERVVVSSAFPLELLAIVAGLRIASMRPGLRKSSQTAKRHSSCYPLQRSSTTGATRQMWR